MKDAVHSQLSKALHNPMNLSPGQPLRHTEFAGENALLVFHICT